MTVVLQINLVYYGPNITAMSQHCRKCGEVKFFMDHSTEQATITTTDQLHKITFLYFEKCYKTQEQRLK